MTVKDSQTLSDRELQKSTLNQRIEDIGWGLLAISIGGILLVPDKLIPPGTWPIGFGLIILGLNGVRYFNGIKINSFNFALGAFALAAGLGDLFSIKLPLFAIFLIFIGISIILKPLTEKAS
jgi:hypothetical protein